MGGDSMSSAGGDHRLSKPTKAAQGVNGTCNTNETASSFAKRLRLVSAGPRRCVFVSTPGTYRPAVRAANPRCFVMARGSQSGPESDENHREVDRATCLWKEPVESLARHASFPRSVHRGRLPATPSGARAGGFRLRPNPAARR